MFTDCPKFLKKYKMLLKVDYHTKRMLKVNEQEIK